MPMISYAQNGEDVLLNRLFPEGCGFYIDIGANDPVEYSVTKHFYDRGWRGINIEPEPAAFSRMVAGRPEDLNLNLGISDKAGVLTFYEAPHANGWSTFSPGQAANLRARGIGLVEHQIPVKTLADLCREHVGVTIDFLKIDAESHETEIMAGADWSRWRPRALLVEANGNVVWEPALLASGYHFALFDGINRFYVRDEDKALLPRFATMANFVDDYIPHAHSQALEDLRGRLAAAEKKLEEIPAWVRKLGKFSRRQSRPGSLLDGSEKRAG